MGAYRCSVCNRDRCSHTHGYIVCERCGDAFCENCAQNEEDLCEGCYMDLKAKAEEQTEIGSEMADAFDKIVGRNE